MSAPPGYRELFPHAALRPWVECFWRQRAPAAAARAQRVLPDGCADVLLDLGRGEAWLIGAMSRPFEFVPDGAVDLLGVRFRPGGAHALLRDALDPWTDGRVALAELGPWARELAARACERAPTEEHVVRLTEALLRRLGAARADAVHGALRALAAEPAAFRVGAAAAAAGLSRQWLTRAIRARAGLGPKELARILRLRRALAARSRSLAERALDGGFADQAHFTREARRIAGATPARLVARG